jgi:hypothetical protein
MRTLHAIAIALAAAVSVATIAPAAAQAPDQTFGPTIRVPAPQPLRYRVQMEEFNEQKGKFILSNGKSMTVTNRGSRFYAEIDGERRAELIPVGRDVYIARDRDMMVLFNEESNGRVHDVVIRPRRQVG